MQRYENLILHTISYTTHPLPVIPVQPKILRRRLPLLIKGSIETWRLHKFNNSKPIHKLITRIDAMRTTIQSPLQINKSLFNSHVRLSIHDKLNNRKETRKKKLGTELCWVCWVVCRPEPLWFSFHQWAKRISENQHAAEKLKRNLRKRFKTRHHQIKNHIQNWRKWIPY